MVRLAEMTPSEFDAFRESTARLYADENVRTGGWEAEGALEKARAEVQRLLPEGQSTTGHRFQTIRRGPDDLRVGETWYAYQPCPGGQELFIYWIGVDEAHRRKGYSTAALGFLEAEARHAGAVQMGLHVFGDNLGAQAAYRQFGFEPKNIRMVKPLPRQAP